MKRMDLTVGSFVRLNRGEPIPADVVLFCASSEDRPVWEDTTQLDGENPVTMSMQAPAIHSSGLQERIFVRVEVAEDDWTFAVTVFTGIKTKLMLHARIPTKRSQVEETPASGWKFQFVSQGSIPSVTVTSERVASHEVRNQLVAKIAKTPKLLRRVDYSGVVPEVPVQAKANDVWYAAKV